MLKFSIDFNVAMFYSFFNKKRNDMHYHLSVRIYDLMKKKYGTPWHFKCFKWMEHRRHRLYNQFKFVVVLLESLKKDTLIQNNITIEYDSIDILFKKCHW